MCACGMGACGALRRLATSGHVAARASRARVPRPPRPSARPAPRGARGVISGRLLTLSGSVRVSSHSPPPRARLCRSCRTLLFSLLLPRRDRRTGPPTQHGVGVRVGPCATNERRVGVKTEKSHGSWYSSSSTALSIYSTIKPSFAVLALVIVPPGPRHGLAIFKTARRGSKLV